MSFGFSIFDIASFVQLTWQVVEGAKAACGEHDDLTKEMVTLHTVMSHIESEMRDPYSILGKNRDRRLEGLGNHVEGCKDHLKRLNRLLRKYNTLSKSERSAQRLWQKAKFGNREVINVKESRQKIRTYTDAISITLQLFSAGSQSKVERQLNRQTGSLHGIQESVNLVLAKLTATGTHDGSVMTDYHGDDKTFWRNLRRELVVAGFSSEALRGQERLIKNYVKELGQRGVLDDRNASTTTLPLIKELKIPQESIDGSLDVRPQSKRAEKTKAKEVVGVRDIHEEHTNTEDSSADSESDSSVTLQNGDGEDIRDEGQESVLQDGKDESSTGSECESSNTESEDEDVSDEDPEPVKDDVKDELATGNKIRTSVSLREYDYGEVGDDGREQLKDNGKYEASTDNELVALVTHRDNNDDDLNDAEPKPVEEDGKKESLTESRSQSPVRFANHDDEVLSNEKVSLVEEKKLLGEKYIDDDDSYTDNDSDEDEAELFFSASVVRKFFRQETAVSLERKTGLTSSENPNERVHVLLFQASCEEVLDVEFIPGSHPNVVAPDFPQLCPRSEIPTLKNDMLQRKDLPVADEIKTPESSNTQDKWVFYPHLALLEPKSRKFNFWLQTTTQEFQTRYDEYITRTRDSIEKLDTLIQITRKAPSSSEDAYTREISFWSEIVDTTEGIIKLLYRREFEAVFYAKVCGTVIQQAGPVPNDEDLKQHQIPEGYFSSRWDATKEPICLNGNVFDVHSLGTHFHLWSAYIWGLSSKQAKTARAFKTEMTTFQDAFSETARCLENIYKAGNVYPTDQQELVSLGNGIWKKLKGAIHKLNIIPPGYYEHESPNCRYARAFHDHIGEGDWVELREEMDKFCALVYSELDYEPLEDYETL